MNEDEEMRNFDEDEADELNIEGLTDVQGGINENESFRRGECGLGCFIGAGYGPVNP